MAVSMEANAARDKRNGATVSYMQSFDD
jgi:hypothetical protein